MQKQLIYVGSFLLLFTLALVNCEKKQTIEELAQVENQTVGQSTDRSCGFTLTGSIEFQVCGPNMGTTTCELCDHYTGTLSRPGKTLNIIATAPGQYRVVAPAAMTISVNGGSPTSLTAGQTFRIDIDAFCNITYHVNC